MTRLDILYRSVHNVNARESKPHRENGMARPREFDEVTALEAAIECFWRRGYEATSVRDLAEKMGLSAPSLYNAYGDKQALYKRALEHYLDHAARALIKQLEGSLPPKQAVRRFIEEIIEHSVSDRERRGCFLINSALEVAPHDRELRAFVAEPDGSHMRSSDRRFPWPDEQTAHTLGLEIGRELKTQ